MRFEQQFQDRRIALEFKVLEDGPRPDMEVVATDTPNGRPETTLFSAYLTDVGGTYVFYGVRLLQAPAEKSRFNHLEKALRRCAEEVVLRAGKEAKA